MNIPTCLFFANLLWFGFFFFAIIYLHWTPWCLAVPIIFHWRYSDFIEKDKDVE